jgi:hypothetical protein
MGNRVGRILYFERERKKMMKMGEENRKRKRILIKEILRKKTIGSEKGTVRDRKERHIVREMDKIG